MPSLLCCQEEHASAWNTFVRANGGHYGHLYEWKTVLERSYGLECHFLAVLEQGAWRAILPLARLPWPRSGRLVSLPYNGAGGLLPVNCPAAPPLLREWMAEKGFSSLELRHLAPEAAVTPKAQVDMVLRLPGDAETYLNGLSRKKRGNIRNVQRKGMTLAWGADQIDEFYRAYAENMGHLGTPVHAKKYFREIAVVFGAAVEILTVWKGKELLGGMLILVYEKSWAVLFSSCRPPFSSLNPNECMYYEAICQAILRKAREFDFGRSPEGSNTWQFKRRWGCEAIPLDYVTLTPEGLDNRASAKFYATRKAKMAALGWSRLPGGIQNLLGPLLRKYIP